MTARKQYSLGDDLPSPENLESLAQFLQTRRSSLVVNLNEPGPSPAQLDDILTIAARVPDHRRLSPFRFLIIEGERRQFLGEQCLQIALAQNPDMPDALQAVERARFTRAPVVIVVVFSPKDDGKTPQWEQTLSCGASCYNVLLAANALGYGAQWITEWLTYSDDMARTLGLLDHERIAGFVYIGTNKEPLKERARPDVTGLTTYL